MILLKSILPEPRVKSIFPPMKILFNNSMYPDNHGQRVKRPYKLNDTFSQVENNTLDSNLSSSIDDRKSKLLVNITLKEGQTVRNVLEVNPIEITAASNKLDLSTEEHREGREGPALKRSDSILEENNTISCRPSIPCTTNSDLTSKLTADSNADHGDKFREKIDDSKCTSRSSNEEDLTFVDRGQKELKEGSNESTSPTFLIPKAQRFKKVNNKRRKLDEDDDLFLINEGRKELEKALYSNPKKKEKDFPLLQISLPTTAKSTTTKSEITPTITCQKIRIIPLEFNEKLSSEDKPSDPRSKARLKSQESQGSLLKLPKIVQNVESCSAAKVDLAKQVQTSNSPCQLQEEPISVILSRNRAYGEMHEYVFREEQNLHSAIQWREEEHRSSFKIGNGSAASPTVSNYDESDKKTRVSMLMKRSFDIVDSARVREDPEQRNLLLKMTLDLLQHAIMCVNADDVTF